MIHFDEAHRAVYYPDDRRFRIWIRPSILIPLLILALGPFVLAWIQNAILGLPYIAPAIASHESPASDPHGRKDQISPRLWPNGKMPERDDWKDLAAGNFKDYKLKVAGLVENPVELSLADLRALGGEEFITMHHCIQGWTGIAQWGGLSMKKLIDHVKPKPSAKVIAFYSLARHFSVPPITRRRHWITRSSRSACWRSR